MKKIPFNIKFRPAIELGKMKVVTANDKPVSILRWDMVGNYPILGCTMVKRCNWEGDESWEEERPIAYNKEGHPEGFAPAQKMELFVLIEKPVQTVFEKELESMIEYVQIHAKPGVDVVDIFKERILDAARIEFINRLWHNISLEDKPKDGAHCLILVKDEDRILLDQGKWNMKEMRWDFTTFNNIQFGYADRWCYRSDILPQSDAR